MFIYKITNTKNGKIYIGQTTPNNNRRLSAHRYLLNKGIHPNPHLQSAWNKYGEKNFTFEKIYKANSVEELESKEAYYINLYESNNRTKGYNIRGSKNGPHIHSNETKLKISKANTGNYHLEELKLKWAKEKRIHNYPKYIESPNGELHEVINLHEFSREHNLDRANLMRVLLGKSKETLGWKLPQK